MYIPVVNKKFERVIERSFVKFLSVRGYEREGHQFYLKSGRVGKRLLIKPDPEPTHHGQVAIFTLHVRIISDDVRELTYPDQALSVSPFQEYPYYTFHRNLGQFYGKKRGDQ
jgi:hypothetical protein